MSTHHMSACPCPYCGYLFDAASNDPTKGEIDRPEPGDFSLCIKCAGFLRFADDLTLCAIEFDELVMACNWDTWMSLNRARNAILAMNAKGDP